MLTQEIISKIPTLYEQYHNKKKVAEELGISPTSVQKYLAIFNGQTTEVFKKERRRVSNEDIEKINEEFKKCCNMSEVAKRIGFSPATVKKYLSEENLALVKKQWDDRDALWYYMIRLFGIESEEEPVSSHNVVLMERFKKQGISYKAQLLTLKWYYEVQNNPVKEEYRTLGLIPYIIDRAAAYYKQQEKKRLEFEAAIEKQLQQDRITIKYNPKNYIGKKRKKKKIDLTEISGDST